MTSVTAAGKSVLIFVFALLLASCAGSPGPSPTEKASTPEESKAAAQPAETASGEDVDASEDAPADASKPDEAEGEEADSKSQDPKPMKRRPARIVLDTVYDDQRVGEDQTQLIEAELGLVKDEDLNEYVRSVAIRLLRYAPSRPLDYEFKIVDQSVPNAFALPGGKIFVSRGLLALATSEDELAGVIGHEITHSAERHASAQMEYNRRMNPLTIGLMRAAKIAAYGRDQERDADRGGQILAGGGPESGY